MAKQKCYAVDGSIADDIPCGLPSSNQCCGSGWDCLSNGLCQQHGSTSFSQGSCTNPQYDQCLSICNKAEYEGATEVSSCGINLWCCAEVEGLSGGPDCCGTNRQTTLQPYPYQTILAGQVGTSGSSSGASPTPLSTTPTSKDTTTTTSETATSHRTSAAAQTFKAGSDAGLSMGEKIGIGVDVPLGVLLLMALAFFIYRSEKNGRHLKKLMNGHRGDSQELNIHLTDPKEPSYVYELQSAEIGELEGSDRKQELASHTRYEIDDTRMLYSR